MTEGQIGARVASLREAAGLTGEQLGALLGLTKSQISKVENGTRRLDVSEVALIADALGVTLAELLGVKRSGSLALAARVMTAPKLDETQDSRRRVRQVLEAEAALNDAMGLKPAGSTAAGEAIASKIKESSLTRGRSEGRAGVALASLVREALGLGRGPIADMAEVCERHFGLSVLIWPTGRAVSGLCAHGDAVSLILISSSFAPGHQRFTAAHELAHHLLSDPREIIIESDLYDTSNPIERRANAFAAAFLLPRDGLVEVVADRPIDEAVIAELMRSFGVSYTALIYRLSHHSVRLLTTAERDLWLARTVTSVLRAANDASPQVLMVPDEQRRIPPRLWRAAQQGYQTGRVGLGVLAALADEDAEDLYLRLAETGVRPPPPDDDLSDL